MRIGILHNAYRFRGGEDRVAISEADLLASGGHYVSTKIFDNRVEYAQLGPKLRSTIRTAGGWNRSAADAIAEWTRAERLDLVHAHNIYPFITGAGLDVLRQLRVPVVTTLHNFRPLCAAGTLTRNGERCEACLDSGPLPAIRHACYRGSVTQSMSWALANHRSRAAGVWTNAITRFIAPSTHVKDTYVRAGFDATRIVVRPHFTNITPPAPSERRGVIVVGRVEQSKGVLDLIDAWPAHAPRLSVIGEGADLEQAKAKARPNIRFVGQLDREALSAEFGRAAVLISASQLPETFGLTLAEAAACRTPAVAFATGAHCDIIENGKTGYLADRGDFRSLIFRAVRLATDPARIETMGEAARARYLARYTPDAGLRSLEAIYTETLRPSIGYAA
ncbi:MAG: glycosyltransferase family 4 protein [Planctomycetota bacterium]